MSIYRPLVSTALSAANQEKPGERLGEERLEGDGKERRGFPPASGLRLIQAAGAEWSPGKRVR